MIPLSVNFTEVVLFTLLINYRHTASMRIPLLIIRGYWIAKEH